MQKSSGKRKKGEKGDEDFDSEMEDSDDDEETVAKEEKMQGSVDHKAELDDLEAEGKQLSFLILKSLGEANIMLHMHMLV